MNIIPTKTVELVEIETGIFPVDNSLERSDKDGQVIVLEQSGVGFAGHRLLHAKGTDRGGLVLESSAQVKGIEDALRLLG